MKDPPTEVTEAMPPVLFKIAYCYKALWHPEVALQYNDRVRLLLPGENLVILQRAEILDVLGHREEGTRMLRDLLARSPDFRPARERLDGWENEPSAAGK
jgi:hypothetical protein